ncbi:uncharacterized protein LOC119642798 [Glossina fuscipes]|uniref:Uncharacterized protein LOC119642798 n=1 Tax=Glossina fuscipes TaxID=7396 RepID=A0A9C5ZN57_9MUSC|nr:uncharacterized protein LOC119642798 [Glossina fuscipes]KAI9576079.1 hypothetical protein GQX74_014562 [Glossina fuscipes]
MEDCPTDARQEEILRNQSRHFRAQVKCSVGAQADLASKKLCSSKAINTENSDGKHQEFIQEEVIMKAVHELEQWKRLQMENILNKLADKEDDYKNDLKKRWEEVRAEKFGQLRAIKNDQMQTENARLERENANLKARTELLTSELNELRSLHISPDYLLHFRTDLRKQNTRIALIEKSRKNFKKQLIKAFDEINKLKTACIELKEMAFKRSIRSLSKNQLTKIGVNKEKGDMGMEESNDIKITLFVSSGSSSECNEMFANSFAEDGMDEINETKIVSM